ncbi:MerR family transcriptional regulator [Schleiferilactobacillus harbinensis]|jgi:DNA-binding transcriptional MerR regulator|uniref:MerR family transcriptional regulator n=1 Tax=Schleiferilactobacillus harbinensis DSM 16991 TaxID=1122147 RepID=A0A0R1XN47_9LACO|nr:MerR family transcriptional regulator [Schleiferilactobacillus harbinensis]KRM28076.1 MerR family transcriptional regulator [Schleiferilactobacillus harbinensis DSM 16991]QFR63579.1 MerR family transcriptional regulator [Schleiferilactobacillus harbinensis]
MTYSIKEAAALTGLSVYTLRFYDQQGLLPFVGRNQAGYRVFTDSDLNMLHTICCLKNTNMAIKEIRQYVAYCMAGPTTIPARQELLAKQRAAVLAEQRRLTANLKEIDYKLDIYLAPDAVAIITQERRYVQAEKAAAGLPDPYAAAELRDS